MSEILDDAAIAALFGLRAADREHIGLLYEKGGIQRTPAQTRGHQDAARGRFEIPKGSLRGLFHNHPIPAARPGSSTRNLSRFSPDDVAQAKELRVPSYIGVGDTVRRYDAGAAGDRGEEVLGRFPIEEWRAELMRTLLGRSPDDPRGAYR